MPMTADNKESKGFAFIEFVDKKSAAAAVEQTDGHKLDKNHVFSVCRSLCVHICICGAN